MNRIRECRQNKKLTLKQLRKELAKKKFKISADALGKYERGEREPKLETWLKLANFFNVSVAYLMGLNNSPNNNFDNIFLKEAPYDIDEWNNLFDTNSTKISTSLSAEQESTVVNSLKTYKSILISLIPYIIKEKLDTNELEKLKKNNLKMLINIVNTLDTDFWPESHITTMDDLENSDLKIQKKLNNILKKINKLLKDELKSN